MGDLTIIMVRAASVLVVALTCSSCALPLVDRTERIAVITLEGEWHTFDKEVYAAAIRARFPKGTPIAGFEAFVKRLRGNCHPKRNESDVVWCEVPIKAGICWAELLGFDVVVQGGTISSIEVYTGGLSC